MIITRPELRGHIGMVASTHWLASAVAMAMLERGGNAFDAAVAGGLVLQVAEPHLNGPAGEVPVLVYDAAEDRVDVMAGQGPAPMAASIAHFTDLGLDRVPGTGNLAACVPAAFDTWMRLGQERGRLELRELMEPAIGYARRGVPVTAKMAATLAGVEQLFRDEWPTSEQLWLGGGVPREGQWVTNPTLAATFERILEASVGAPTRAARFQAARDAFYRGSVAETIDRWVRTAAYVDTSGERHRGLLTGADLAAFEVPVEHPVSVDYHGWTVYKPDAWSQAPVFLQQLRLLEGFDLDATGPHDPDFLHLVIEAAKLGFADREAWYGDPRFADVPMATLLDRRYADQRRELIGEQASMALRPGSPDGRTPILPPALPDIEGSGSALGGVGEPTVAADGRVRGDTCHLDVVDREGNMVSATPSGGWLQSSPAIPELGFALGTRAQMFWLDHRHPNGLVGGKRPRTTLTCTMAGRDGRIRLAFGTPGGDRQDQWSLVYLLRLLHHGLDLQEAIDAPTFHSDHFPSSFFPRRAQPGQMVVEDRFPEETIEELLRRGHGVQVAAPWSLGRLSAVGADGEPGPLKAAANPRGRQGYAVGR